MRARSPVFLAAGLALAFALTGCAKRPALTQAAAPAPTGVAAPVAPAVPAPPPAALTPAVPPVAAPAAPPAPKPEEFAALPELRDIYFDFDKSEIRSDAADVLQASAAWLREHPKYLVLIEGHCDERGTDAYNLALGERRSHAALTYLVAHGVEAKRVTTISYGEERPVCTAHNEACWSKNRRAHFLVKAE